MPISGPQSVIEEDSLYAGFWSAVYVVVDPLTAATRFNLGVVSDGVLRVEREETEFLGTTFPRIVEVVLPTRVDMSFAGVGNELRARLIHFLVGDERIDSVNPYVYPGASCATFDVQFNGERINCNNQMIAFRFHRARASGAVEIGGADEVIGTPMEINALNDTNGDFGGSVDSPLGFIWFTNV